MLKVIKMEIPFMGLARVKKAKGPITLLKPVVSSRVQQSMI